MRIVIFVLPLLAGACAPTNPDPRGVAKGETFLTISATGRAEARPNEARMQLGVTSQGANAGEASRLKPREDGAGHRRADRAGGQA